MPPSAQTLPLRPPVIVHHMAALDGQFPPNSLAAIRACLEANAVFIEIDVTALAREDYLLVHDPVLDSETTGVGAVEDCAPDEARKLHYRGDYPAGEQPLALLSDVVRLFLEFSGTRLQIDFKNVLPMTDEEPLNRLIKLIQPLGNRVMVSSTADWQLRRLRKLAPWLDLGFDIGFYLDWIAPNQTVDPRQPPFKLGDYGYRDDHILAAMRIWSTADYLAERCEQFIGAVPDISTFYISHELLAQSLDDGFNWATALHAAGIILDAWTLDSTNAQAVEHARRLLAAGVDQFTTNTPAALRELLSAPANT